MDAKEKICAQNWVEQFMNEAQRTRNGEEMFPHAASAKMCIDCAFPWEETRQGYDIWGNRCYTLDEDANVR